MLTLVGVGLVWLAALLQATVLPVILPQLLRPDLVVLLVVAMAIAGSLREAALWAFAGGLFLDMLSTLPLGTNALCLLLTAVLAGLATLIPFRAQLVMPLGMAFLGTGSYDLLLLGMRSLLGQHFNWAGAGRRGFAHRSFQHRADAARLQLRPLAG